MVWTSTPPAYQLSTIKCSTIFTKLTPQCIVLLEDIDAATATHCRGAGSANASKPADKDERLTAEQRTFRYCRKTVRNDHFDDHHLEKREQAAQRGEAIRCEHPKCKDLTFIHLDHFKNHVATVHGVWLRCSQRVNKRRMKKLQRRRIAKGKGLRWTSSISLDALDTKGRSRHPHDSCLQQDC